MAGEMIKVLIVDDLPETRTNLQKLLAFEADIEVVAVAATGQEGIDFTRKFEPDIVLIDINMPDMDGIAATRQIKTLRPSVGVIIMSVQSEADYLRHAMQAGARGFVSKPISSDNLYQTILEVYGLQAEERAKITDFIPSNIEAGQKVKSGGHLIAVYSPQGGAGVTTIATNLAVAMMHEGARVVLIDADLQWGDVGVFLNLTAKYTISDLADAITELDQQIIENMIVTHASGLKVLLAPYNLQDAERISPANLVFIIQQIALYYDYIIVDMPKYLDHSALSLLESAARIVLVATPTLPAIKSTRTLLNMFLAYPPEKVMLLMNRVNYEAQGRTAIPLDAIENHLSRRIDIRIPVNHIAFLTAVNQGVSVIAVEPAKSPALDLIQLAHQVRHSLGEDAAEVIAPAVLPTRPRRAGIWGSSTG